MGIHGAFWLVKTCPGNCWSFLQVFPTKTGVTEVSSEMLVICLGLSMGYTPGIAIKSPFSGEHDQNCCTHCPMKKGA